MFLGWNTKTKKEKAAPPSPVLAEVLQKVLASVLQEGLSLSVRSPLALRLARVAGSGRHVGTPAVGTLWHGSGREDLA